ncbi:MAG: hypothetical protein PHX87_06105 [Candidatus Peribacteraceae bacterium]|nr:hypothetical protein [Candidatus Peribacteraceae bacterium]MDD5742963.1 hypothetical protein [Candidatus Peribacteraceae bacterium]
MDKPVYTIVEEDLQTVARERINRNLTADEMRRAIRAFEIRHRGLFVCVPHASVSALRYRRFSRLPPV